MAASRGGKKRRTPPPRLVFQDQVPLGPALPPESYRVGMELHLRGSRSMRKERLVVQEQDQGGALPPLQHRGALMGQAFRLRKECGWKNGPVRRCGTRHGSHPLRNAVLIATDSLQRVPKKG